MEDVRTPPLKDVVQIGVLSFFRKTRYERLKQQHEKHRFVKHQFLAIKCTQSLTSQLSQETGPAKRRLHEAEKHSGGLKRWGVFFSQKTALMGSHFFAAENRGVVF